MDSFDHYSTADLAAKYASIGTSTIAAGQGRRGTACLSPSVLSLVLPPSTDGIVVGDAVRQASIGGHQTVYQLLSASNFQCSIAVSPTGYLEAWRGLWNVSGTLLQAATTGPVTAGAYYYIEAKIVIHPTAGSMVVRVNELTVINVTGVNTAGTGSTGWDTLQLLGGGQLHDDLYVLDTTGSGPLNDFLGDCRVDARFVSGAGALAQWTPSAGVNYQNVDDATPNGDTDYNATATVGNTDTFPVADVAAPGATFYGAQLAISHRKTDAGGCTIAPVVRIGTTNYPASPVNPSTSYLYTCVPYGAKPGGGAWTEADFNAAEFGYTRTA
jgi:hypothetical protein